MAKGDERVSEVLPPSTIDDRTGSDLLLDRLRVEYRARRRARHGVVALTDNQLSAIMAAASPLPPEKRSVLLERTAAHLQLYGRRSGRRFSDTDVACAVRASLLGLRP
jgi:hypothetical protein